MNKGADSKASPQNQNPLIISQWNVWWIVWGLCLFIACLSFKPSEPYLTQYLVCNYNTQLSQCQDSYNNNLDSCNNNPPCQWIPDDSGTSTGGGGSCGVVPCNEVSYSDCGNDDYDYCYQDNENNEHTCNNEKCYKHFTEDQVNNDIYPWSTYAYLPFLLFLGPFAEIVSYKYAILCGILGRVATRVLLIYGTSLQEMQLMQVVYSLGTAAEDVFSAYVYYVVSIDHYQAATSYIKASAMMACVLSGILGDLLVVEGGVSLRVLMWISAAFVWTGFVVGIVVIRNAHQVEHPLAELESRSKHSSMSHKASISQRSVGGGTGGTGGGTGRDSPNPDQFFKESPFYHSATGQHAEHLKSAGVGVGGDDFFGGAGRASGVTGGGGGDNVATNLDRNRFVREVFEGKSNVSGGWKATVLVFRKQLLYLTIALKANSFRMLLGLWILGNAIFSILYNYEVSIYQELAGSNDWNGSVLAIMLLCGSVGAMLPTWLHNRATPLDEHQYGQQRTASAALITGGVTVPDSEIVIAYRLIIASIIASLSLIWFILSWSLIQSITALALFFACWQYINAIVFSRIAMYLKLAQIHIQLHGEEASRQAAATQGKRFSSRRDSHGSSSQHHRQSASSTTNRGTNGSKGRTSMLDPAKVLGGAGSGRSTMQSGRARAGTNNSLLMRNVTIGSVTTSVDNWSMRSSSNIFPGHLLMHGLTLQHPTLPPGTPMTPQQQQQGQGQGATMNPVLPADYLYAAGYGAGGGTGGDNTNTNGAGLPPSEYSDAFRDSSSSSHAGGYPVYPQPRDSDVSAVDANGNPVKVLNPHVVGDSTGNGGGAGVEGNDDESAGEGEGDGMAGGDDEALHEIIDPPYSFAVVAVIAVNVAVQVILQSILFSSLQWSLRHCCEIFVLIFIATAVAFTCCSMIYFGVSSICEEAKISFQKRTSATWQ